jgi:sugar phosphate isomerase/epimerase
MKLGLLTAPLGDRPRNEAFQFAKSLGYDAVELGSGEFTTDYHVGLTELAGNEAATQLLRDDLASAGLELSALSCHGNPLHPNPAYASRAREVITNSIRLAAALNVPAVNLFSGCPGTPDGGDYPNWVVHPWPQYFGDLLDWQWTEHVIPYWSELAAFAAQHQVGLAIEMHPSNVVYNTDTLLRLRANCGTAIGANFDPSHLWWQGINPITSLRAIATAGGLLNIHVKDTALDHDQISRTGVIAVPETGQQAPWRFTTVGHGHDPVFWKSFFDELTTLGYEGVLSVEHEDELAPVEEALVRSLEFIRSCTWRENASGATWLEAHDPPYPNPDKPWARNPKGASQPGGST